MISLSKIFGVLNSNTHPGEIAHAISCGFLLGLMPKNNLFWYLVFVFVLFLRINKPFYALLLLAGTAFAPLFDPLFDTVGYAFLTIPALSGFFGNLLEIPFVAFTKFNNSIVMGSFLCGVVLYAPLYFLARLLISLYRKHIASRLVQSRLAKKLSKLSIFEKIIPKVVG